MPTKVFVRQRASSICQSFMCEFNSVLYGKMPDVFPFSAGTESTDLACITHSPHSLNFNAFIFYRCDEMKRVQEPSWPPAESLTLATRVTMPSEYVRSKNDSQGRTTRYAHANPERTRRTVLSRLHSSMTSRQCAVQWSLQLRWSFAT